MDEVLQKWRKIISDLDGCSQIIVPRLYDSFSRSKVCRTHVQKCVELHGFSDQINRLEHMVVAFTLVPMRLICHITSYIRIKSFSHQIIIHTKARVTRCGFIGKSNVTGSEGVFAIH